MEFGKMHDPAAAYVVDRLERLEDENGELRARVAALEEELKTAETVRDYYVNEWLEQSRKVREMQDAAIKEDGIVSVTPEGEVV